MRDTGLLKSTQSNNLARRIKKRLPDVINCFVTNGFNHKITKTKTFQNLASDQFAIFANSNYLLSNNEQ